MILLKFRLSFFIQIFLHIFLCPQRKVDKRNSLLRTNREIPTRLMESPQRRFTSSFEEILCLIASLEFLAIFIARSPLIRG